jgi:nucleotide-binding universal stress UspA family protein
VRDLRAASVEALGSKGHDVPIRILHGDPGQRLCEYADYLDCDLIVLGPRSRGSLARTLRGSVSRYVLDHTRRHVLVLGGPTPSAAEPALPAVGDPTRASPGGR